MAEDENYAYQMFRVMNHYEHILVVFETHELLTANNGEAWVTARWR